MLAKVISTLFVVASMALAASESSDGLNARDPAPLSVPANRPALNARQSKNRRLNWDELCALWQNQNCGHSCIPYSSLCCDQGGWARVGVALIILASGAHCDK